MVTIVSNSTQNIGRLMSKEKKTAVAKTLFIPIIMSVLMGVVSVPSAANSLKIGDIAPDFSVKTINGKSVNLSDFTYKNPVYLKFWATWCAYCKVEMPHLQAIYDANGTEIKVLTVNVAMNDSIANINKFYRKNGFDLPTVFDQSGALTSSYGVIGTPYHVLINKQGRIAYRTFLATDELDERIALLSKESSTATVSKPK